jgi:hypothetical protein
MAEAKKRGINLKSARIEAKMAQFQAMKALVRAKIYNTKKV